MALACINLRSPLILFRFIIFSMFLFPIFIKALWFRFGSSFSISIFKLYSIRTLEKIQKIVFNTNYINQQSKSTFEFHSIKRKSTEGLILVENETPPLWVKLLLLKFAI